MPKHTDRARTWISVAEERLIFLQRTRLVLVNMAVLAFIWTLLSVFVYTLEVRETNASIDRRLFVQAERLSENFRPDAPPFPGDKEGYVPDFLIGVWNPAQRKLSLSRPESPALTAALQRWAQIPGLSPVFRSFSVAGTPYRGLLIARGPVRLIAIDDIEDEQSVLHRLLILFILAGCLGVLLTIAGGYLLGSWTLRPLMAAREREKELMSDVSHELRTPLSALTTHVELLLRHAEEPLSSHMQWMEAIYAEVRRMSRMVHELLDLSRLESGHDFLELSTVSVRELCESVTTVYESVLEADGLSFHLQMQGDCRIQADAMRLRQLLIILLDNARKYTRQGSVTLAAHCEAGTAEIRVADTGCGMPEDLLQRTTERFARGRSPRRGEHSTGLGLAIAKRIVEAHRGRLTLQSTVGEGTEVIVRLRTVD